jgi:DNA-directed RNA polymerase specialized sigma24 family protein
MRTDPSASFEPHRRRLLGLAYRMLGSIAEAEDAVQEAYLRWHDADRENVAEPRAFLITTTTRICLDVLRSARVRREEYIGPWLPDHRDTRSTTTDTAFSPSPERSRGWSATRRSRSARIKRQTGITPRMSREWHAASTGRCRARRQMDR